VHGAGRSIDLDDAVEEVAGPVIAVSPDRPVCLAGMPRVVDARQLDRSIRDRLRPHLALAREGNDVAREPAGGVDRLRRAQSSQIELIDNVGIRKRDDVDDQVVAGLIGVDVMKGEGGIGFRRRDRATAVLLEHMKPQAALRRGVGRRRKGTFARAIVCRARRAGPEEEPPIPLRTRNSHPIQTPTRNFGGYSSIVTMT
jgi:hypothetical protein